jgi:hypothetical protein
MPAGPFPAKDRVRVSEPPGRDRECRSRCPVCGQKPGLLQRETPTTVVRLGWGAFMDIAGLRVGGGYSARRSDFWTRTFSSQVLRTHRDLIRGSRPMAPSGWSSKVRRFFAAPPSFARPGSGPGMSVFLSPEVQRNGQNAAAPDPVRPPPVVQVGRLPAVPGRNIPGKNSARGSTSISRADGGRLTRI